MKMPGTVVRGAAVVAFGVIAQAMAPTPASAAALMCDICAPDCEDALAYCQSAPVYCGNDLVDCGAGPCPGGVYIQCGTKPQE